jgi:hypothetical protein
MTLDRGLVINLLAIAAGVSVLLAALSLRVGSTGQSFTTVTPANLVGTGEYLSVVSVAVALVVTQVVRGPVQEPISVCFTATALAIVALLMLV